MLAAPQFYWALLGRADLGAQAAAADAAVRQSWFAVDNLLACVVLLLRAALGVTLLGASVLSGYTCVGLLRGGLAA